MILLRLMVLHLLCVSRTGYLIISNGSALDTKVGVSRDKALEDLGKRFLRLANAEQFEAVLL